MNLCDEATLAPDRGQLFAAFNVARRTATGLLFNRPMAAKIDVTHSCARRHEREGRRAPVVKRALPVLPQEAVLAPAAGIWTEVRRCSRTSVPTLSRAATDHGVACTVAARQT